MPDEFEEELEKQSYKWIKAKSGTTYLCPIPDLQKLEDLDEEQLKTICIDESLNPQS